MGDDEDAPMCRICLGDEDHPDDRLFSPCKCSGSVKYVHENCLKQWRQLSDNPRAMYTCTTCHYKCRIARTDWAHWMAGEKGVKLATAVLLVLVVVVLGFAVKLVVGLYLHNALHMGRFLSDDSGTLPSGERAFFVFDYLDAAGAIKRGTIEVPKKEWKGRGVGTQNGMRSTIRRQPESSSSASSSIRNKPSAAAAAASGADGVIDVAKASPNRKEKEKEKEKETETVKLKFDLSAGDVDDFSVVWWLWLTVRIDVPHMARGLALYCDVLLWVVAFLLVAMLRGGGHSVFDMLLYSSQRGHWNAMRIIFGLVLGSLLFFLWLNDKVRPYARQLATRSSEVVLNYHG